MSYINKVGSLNFSNREIFPQTGLSIIKNSEREGFSKTELKIAAPP
jgi:hypothetical protein